MKSSAIKFLITQLLWFALVQGLEAQPDLKVLIGHSGEVCASEFSPDGKLIASTSTEGVICLWDRETGKELRRWAGLSNGTINVKFTPDGKQVVFQAEKDLQFMDILTDKPGLRLTGHTAAVRNMGFSRDGRFLVSEDWDSTVKKWDLTTGKLALSIKSPNYISDVEISPDGQVIAVSSSFSKSGSIIIYDAFTGVVIKTLDDRDCTMVFSPDSQNLITGTYEKIQVWDWKGNKVLASKTVPKSYAQMIRITPDGQSILYAFNPMDMTLWNWKTDKYTSYFKGHTDNINSLDISGDGKYVLSGSLDHTVNLWDLATGKVIKTLRSFSLPIYDYSKVLTSDGQRVLVSYTDNTLRLWDIPTGKVVHVLRGHNKKVADLTISEDGLVAASSSSEGFIKIWDLKTGKEIYTLRGHESYPFKLTFSSDHRYLLSGSQGREVFLWDLTTGKEKWRNKDHKNWITDLVFSPDNKTVVTGSKDDQSLFGWKTETGERLWSKTSSGPYFNPLAFSPDGQTLTCWAFYPNATSNAGSVVKFIDTLTGKEQGQGGDYSQITYVYSSYESKDKRVLALATKEGEKRLIRRLDLTTRKETITELKFSPQDKDASPGSFLPDGSGILVYGKNLPTKVFDTVTGAQTRVLSPLIPGNYNVYNSDGSIGIAGSTDGTIKVWSTLTGKILYTAMVNEGNETLAWTPEGYFSGSETLARNAVYLQDGMKTLGIDQLYETFYRPDLLEARAGGRNIPGVGGDLSPQKVLSGGGQPPDVRFVTLPGKIESREVTLKFIVRDNGGGVGRITIFVEGQPVTLIEGGRGLSVVEVTSSATKEYSFSALITLRYGANHVEASAYNKNNTIESTRAVLDLAYKDGEMAKPNLIILAVAVDKYRDKALWLNYSLADAQAIGEVLSKKSKTLYHSVTVHKLYDDQVTKEGFSKKFEDISKSIKPDDVFVLYLAGHGVTNEADGDYYFLPVNFRYTGKEDIAAGGISKSLILEGLTKIQAQKTILLFDTCNSGSFIDKPATRGIAEKTAVDRLKRAMGRAIIVASSESQVALEGIENHGVFTFSLLKALNGGIVTSKDYVTVTELCAFIEKEVPDLTYNKWKYEQVPQKDLPKVDFPFVGK